MKRTFQASKGVLPEVEKRVLQELKLGYLNLSDGFFPQAEVNFKLALQLDKACADAFWGLMLVQFECKNEDELYSNPVAYKGVLDVEQCKLALESADKSLRKKYLDLLERIYKIREGENY